ncbi:uncharacterized protein BCR38DRAFT_407487 [Pseudomassariella vexata]|uniref:Copper acquisition factor BIM1-like domain-containing protein n=1 Tax=Pseudomassariella vexata TaxID=1141098 RepID=A0A1Y2E867_9PEZI|nr:uncharacterized protein BCR38DRAFT_407487 [Pseudomassariella vexata]ORY67514.1 hypothetical protein BCR38DRAFT_407487 [Pseudomassariella vexata]
MRVISFLLCLLCAPLIHAHFVLQDPPNIGFDDDKENQAPCGSFDASKRTVVTKYPVDGGTLSMLTTDEAMDITINIAPANGSMKFRTLMKLQIKGTGSFCLPSMPVAESLSGTDALMQVVAKSSDGTLYQCAAVKFVPGTTSKVSADCRNSTGLTVTMISDDTMLGAKENATHSH